MDDAPLWTPAADRVAGSNLRRFQTHVGDSVGVEVPNYRVLHRWSVTEPARFWSEVWDFCGVLGDKGGRLLEESSEFRHTRFLPDATLNVAANLLGERSDDLAIAFRAEDGDAADLTRSELHEMTGSIQTLLLEAGVGVGDRVAAWLPNRPESYAVMLAATGLGAVFCSTSPDFGVDGVLDRFGQIEPKVLFAAPHYSYNGKRHDCLDRLGEITAALPSLVGTFLVEPGWLDGHASQPPITRPMPFDHPWYVLFSSGTTGRPKCIVHRCGGVLLKHLVEHRLQCDVRAGDRVFYFTTTGWMMWNWLASGLGNDAAIVVYDGAPTFPTVERLFDLVDEVGITLFGTSAKFIDACQNAGIRPIDSHDLSSIRSIASTGSTLSPEGFEWVYDAVKADVHLSSMSGGTDLCGCLVAGDPTGAVRAGEIQAPALGLDIDVVDDSGESVEVGVEGELVCRNPFPSMPLRFGDDPGDVRYQAAYFDRFAGMWHHGDFSRTTAAGGYVISGRSDATLNPGGIRIGTAEIYRRVDNMAEITESVVIGQLWQHDTRIVLFVRMEPGQALDGDLASRIRSKIRAELTPRHVPTVILEVDDIPRTRSGKITELAVRDVVEGRAISNVEALANPEALAHFKDRPELA